MTGPRLAGKVALVTGAGRGIGRAIALKLAAEGARLMVNDLDEPVLEALLAEIRATGAEGAGLPGSVTEPDFGERFIGGALERWDDLHILVNNAGFTWDNVIHKMSDEQFSAMLDVHAVAPFRLLRAAAEPFRALSKRDEAAGVMAHRKVVNISSTSGVNGNAGQVNYAAGKAAVVGMTKTLAKEWGRYRVNVNAVAFGYIQTRLTQPVSDAGATVEIEGRSLKIGMPAATLEALSRVIPLGRGGTVEEAAGAVYLLCTPESDYVSGQVLLCAGGYG